MNKPNNISRRGFLRAIGVTTMTAGGLYLAKPDLMAGSRPGLVKYVLNCDLLPFESLGDKIVANWIAHDAATGRYVGQGQWSFPFPTFIGK